jgi:DNA polymerase III gamma/tau subunit
MTTRRKIEEPKTVESHDEPFHIKYRPLSLDKVIGQDAVTKSLKALAKQATRPHAFLFTGPSGCGKTTLSRIMAAELNCQPANILEVDAAGNSGIDAMKEVMSTLRYQGFGTSPNKAIIIDECHSLSKAAWQAMLKPIEEPPPHIFFFLCTTESGKVPETIVTRCHSYMLKTVKFDDVMDLLESVCEAEGLSTPTNIVELAGRACSGSPRQALVMLSMLQDCRDLDEAGRLLETPLENKEVIDLCRLLIKGGLEWRRLVEILKAIPDINPESTRIVIVNYLAACAMGAKSEKEAIRILDIMSCFSKPFMTSDKLAPLLLAFGNLLFD